MIDLIWYTHNLQCNAQYGNLYESTSPSLWHLNNIPVGRTHDVRCYIGNLDDSHKKSFLITYKTFTVANCSRYNFVHWLVCLLVMLFHNYGAVPQWRTRIFSDFNPGRWSILAASFSLRPGACCKASMSFGKCNHLQKFFQFRTKMFNYW